MVIPTNLLGIKLPEFSQKYVESHPIDLQSRQYVIAIVCSEQTFPNAFEFCNAMHLMLLVWRFLCTLKINSMKHVTIACTTEKCPKKITCYVIGLVKHYSISYIEEFS